MIDIVFPKGNENEFIKIAERLNLEGLCFVYEKPTDISNFQKGTKLKISSGILCKPEEVKRHKGKYLTLVRAPEDQMKIRHIIEQSKPDILFDLEFGRQKDFIHHRASGLNHVLADLAKQKNVMVGFDFTKLRLVLPKQRAVYLGRISQNIRFARKYGFKTLIASFAGAPIELRSDESIVSFFKTIGMDSKDAHDSLNWRQTP